MSTLQLNGYVEVTILYQGEYIELVYVGFTGTYEHEEPTGPTASCGGHPGYTDVDIKLTGLSAVSVHDQVRDYFDGEGMFDVVIDSSVEDLARDAVARKVLEEPERYV